MSRDVVDGVSLISSNTPHFVLAPSDPRERTAERTDA